MAGGENTLGDSGKQDAPRVLRKRDGGWVVACNEGSVIKIGRLIITPDQAVFSCFERAVERACDELKADLAAADKDASLLFGFRVSSALDILIEALNP